MGEHKRAGLPARLIPTPHEARGPAGWRTMRERRKQLRSLPDRGASMLDFYGRHNGAELCILPDPLSGDDQPALDLLPMSFMSSAPPDGDSRYEGLGRIYKPGRFLTIAQSPSERTTLSVMLQDGGPEGPRAGEIYYLSMDPVQSCLEPLALSFEALLDRIAADPVQFLNDVGYCNYVLGVGAEKGWFGDPPERYVADTGHRTAEAPSGDPEPPGPLLFE